MSAADLKRFALLADLGEPEREQLAPLLEARALREGDTLFREGDVGEGLVLVAEGRLRLASERAGELGALAEGEALGGVSLVTVGRRECSAVADAPTRVLSLTRAGFRRLESDAPRAASRVLEAVLVQLAESLRGELARLIDVDRARRAD